MGVPGCFCPGYPWSRRALAALGHDTAAAADADADAGGLVD
jgi:hypothetical protein